MSQLDIKNDTAKYIMLLRTYLEAANEDSKNNDFIKNIMEETSRFFKEFQSDYMKALYKEDSHKILYFYGQVAVEKFNNSTKLILPLLVILFESE
jgi:hypothetical protein